MTIQKKLSIALIGSLIIVVSIALGWQHIVISREMARLSRQSAEQNAVISRENENLINDMSKTDAQHLRHFEIQSAEHLFKLINANLAKAIRMGNKSGLRMQLRRQKVGNIKEISVFNPEGIVRFSSNKDALGRPMAEGLMAGLSKNKERLVRSDERGKIEIYVPQIVTRKCTACHIHREWRGREGMVGGVTYASISTREFVSIKEENSRTLVQLSRQNKKRVEEAKSVTRESIDQVLNTFIKSSIATVAAIILLSGITMWFSIGTFVVKPIQDIVKGINKGAAQVADDSKTVSRSSGQLAEGAAHQAAAIEETSASLEQVSTMIRQNVDNTDSANHLMAETHQVVMKAHATMDQLTAAMGEISKSSSEVTHIIRTIDEIAFQTNLLALNAAVEAARAGQAGAGFGVVATEVRNLSIRVAQAAQQTATLIETTGKNIQEGSQFVDIANSAFGEVSQATGKIVDIVKGIAVASDEQAKGIQLVTKAVAEMDKIVQQNAAGAQGSAKAAGTMANQADQLKVFIESLAKIIGGTPSNGRALPDRSNTGRTPASRPQSASDSQKTSPPTGGDERLPSTI